MNARVAYRLAATDPSNDNVSRRLLIPVKNNLTPFPQPASFSIRADESLKWHDQHTTAFAATQLQISEQPRSQVELASQWLTVALASGPVLANTILDDGKTFGFSEAVIRRASQRLAVVKSPNVHNGPWSWQLPPQRFGRHAQHAQHGEHAQHAPPQTP